MPHPAFELLSTRPIPALRLEVQSYRHRATGARHWHLAADDPHNAFLVAFLTVPQDSTGVAHILEHTSLCGSHRYPVRDPFFMMTRRSLNTFMNAFTASDWTAYPFASQNLKDFNNLLDVYLDAVFAPLLSELDFAQEGCRVEFEQADDPGTPLAFRGVVYNEMKGAMSSPVSALAQALQARLFPTTTYHHNSGGDPEAIPDLTHADLRAFHAAHYHPSNAVFMTYGDIPAADHQARFEAGALGTYAAAERTPPVPDERRYSAPVVAEDVYALEDDDPEERTHIVMSWLLTPNTDPMQTLRARVLSDVLLDNSSSPLRHALETTDLGSAPSPLCGFDDATRETTFTCGLEGSEPEHAEALQALVLDVLESVARDGVAPEALESALHQLELSQREITGDGYPYGLRLMLDALAPTLHGADPAAVLDLDPLLGQLREEAADPGFLPRLVRELLLDNPHRVRLTLRPDTELAARRRAAEAARLAALAEGLDEAQRQRLVEQAAALAARQAQQDDPEVLPRVGLEDVPTELRIPEGTTRSLCGMPGSWFDQGTNGMVYQRLVLELPDIDPTLLDLLPLFCLCLSEVGSGGRDYRATQALQAAVTGGLNARYLMRGDLDDITRGRGVVVVSGKALARHHAPLSTLIRDTFASARFDEYTRIRELVAQLRAHRDEAVTDHGHVLAMAAATAGYSPVARLTHRWEGLLGLQRLRRLDDGLEAAHALEDLAVRLATLRDRLQEVPRQLLVVAEGEAHAGIAEALGATWSGQGPGESGSGGWLQPVTPEPRREGWVASSQVNFCAQAYPTVAPNHPDAAALLVLGDFLRNGFLHRAIRERGGAYGGGAGYQPDSGAFRFFSYRDPRLEETLADFDAALDWLQQHRHPARTLEEAILGVIAAIDRPGSPAGEAISAFFGSLFGRTPEQRRAFRQRVLQVQLDDLRTVAERYLRPERASIAVLGGGAQRERMAALGLEIKTL